MASAPFSLQLARHTISGLAPSAVAIENTSSSAQGLGLAHTAGTAHPLFAFVAGRLGEELAHGSQ
jgi:L-lactate permease